MKRLLMWLSIIALTACGGGGGGPSAPTTHSISGNTKPGTALSLVKPVSTSWNDVIVVADTTADATTGKYSFPGIVNGDYEVSAWLTGNTFSPPYVRLKLNGADYPRVDFTAIPNAGTGGITFSATLGGFNSLANTNYVTGEGGLLSNANPNYSITWSDNNGGVASLIYTSQYDIFGMSIGSPSYSVGTCRLVSNATVTSPTCSSIGITLDRVAGVVTFASTPILNAGTNTPTGITATGSLTFPPF